MRKKAASGNVDIHLRFGGEGGEGVISLGEILSTILAGTGWEVMSFKTFPAEIRGGHAFFDLRVSDRPVLCTGDSPDFLLAMNSQALSLHAGSVTPGGMVLADEDAEAEDLPSSLEVIRLPFTAIASRDLSFPRGKNMVCLGAVTRLLNCCERETVHELKVKFGGKGAAVVEKNINCFRMGFKAMASRLAGREEIRLSRKKHETGRYLLDGNEAVGLGALVAGCRFFAGYPITPATGIMEFLADKLPCMGGYTLQMEDEISAMASVLGASFGGVPSMTATSGPGLSLMSELLGLASMAELPAVVVDVQRSGPSTGMPTKTEQSDLDMAVYGMHGEGPKAVLAAADATDCFYQCIEAFRIAETYQMPVLLLSDQQLAYTKALVSTGDLEHVKMPPRKAPTVPGDDFQRYAPSEDGISPMPAAGDPGFRYTVTGLEHDPFGKPSYAPGNRREMVAKRARKMAVLAAEKGGVSLADDGGDVGLVTWGSTRGAAVEARERAEEEGIRVAHCHLHRLAPLPVEALRAFAAGKRRLVVAEMNSGGQMARMAEAALHRPVERFGSSSGIPFSPARFLDMMREIAK